MKPFNIRIDSKMEMDFVMNAVQNLLDSIKNESLDEQRTPGSYDDMVTYEEAGTWLWKKLVRATR